MTGCATAFPAARSRDGSTYTVLSYGYEHVYALTGGHPWATGVMRGRAYGALPDREKRYVGVVTLTTADGLVTPLEILWDDGRRFKVDRVTGRRQAHSLKTGGTGMRYSVRVAGHDTC